MATFQKRHYAALAETMQEARLTAANVPDATDRHAAVNQWIVTTEALADMLARDSGTFQRDRFLAACEPGANVKARRAS